MFPVPAGEIPVGYVIEACVTLNSVMGSEAANSGPRGLSHWHLYTAAVRSNHGKPFRKYRQKAGSRIRTRASLVLRCVATTSSASSNSSLDEARVE